MNKLKYTLSFLVILICSRSFAQNYLLLETNLDPKKNSQYFNVFKKCDQVLQKKEAIGSLPFSPQCKQTNNSIRTMSERYENLLPKSKPTLNDKSVKRAFNASDKTIKYTFLHLQPKEKTTQDYLQLVVTFDKSSASPKILDIQFRTKSDNGILTLTDNEIAALTAKPKPATPAKSTPAKKKTAPATKKK